MRAIEPDLRWDVGRGEWVYTFRCSCRRRWSIAQNDLPFTCLCGARSDLDRTGT